MENLSKIFEAWFEIVQIVNCVFEIVSFSFFYIYLINNFEYSLDVRMSTLLVSKIKFLNNSKKKYLRPQISILKFLIISLKYIFSYICSYPFVNGTSCPPSGLLCLSIRKWPTSVKCNCLKTCIEIVYTQNNLKKINW